MHKIRGEPCEEDKEHTEAKPETVTHVLTNQPLI
jgi:hypothetical protein